MYLLGIVKVVIYYAPALCGNPAKGRPRAFKEAGQGKCRPVELQVI